MTLNKVIEIHPHYAPSYISICTSDGMRRAWYIRYRRCSYCGREVGYYGPTNHAENCPKIPPAYTRFCIGKKPIKRLIRRA